MDAIALRSAILIGRVMHSRRSPVEHTFEYPVYLYRINLDELEALPSKLAGLFGHNRFRPIAIWDRDYLFPDPDKESETIKERLFRLLDRHGIDSHSVASVQLVTGARFFGYVFNPVNFYYCYDANHSLLGHVVEINNTYHQRHPYILFNGEGSKERVSYSGAKRFFVSPFNTVDGEYSYSFGVDADSVDVRINLRLHGEQPLITRLWGCCTPLTVGALLATLLRFPLGAILTMPRILWQAQLLRFKKRLPMYDPPPPSSPDTLNFKS